MNWMTSGSKPVDLSQYSCQDVVDFFSAVQSFDNSARSLETILDEIGKSSEAKSLKGKLANLLLDRVKADGPDAVRDLMLSLDTLSSKQVDAQQDGKFLWEGINFALQAGVERKQSENADENNKSSSLNLEISTGGAISFALLDDAELENLQQRFVFAAPKNVSCLSITGESRIGLDVGFRELISVDYTQERKRSFKIYSRQDQLSTLTGVALGRAFRRIPDLKDINSVVAMLGAGICDQTLAMEWQVANSSDSQGKVNATFVSKAGAFNFVLDARYEYESGFTYLLSEDDGWLRLVLVKNEASRKSNSLGLSYRFGLDSFGSDAVQKVLSVFGDADMAIAKLDALLDKDYSKILSPTKHLNSLIDKKLSSWSLDVPSLFPEFKLDLGPGFVNRIQMAINDQSDLFSLGAEESSSLVLDQILPINTELGVNEALRDRFKEKVLVPILNRVEKNSKGLVSDLIKDSEILSFIETITDKTKEKKARVQDFLDGLRSNLKSIARQVEMRSNNLLSVEFSRSRVRTEQNSFYVQVDFNPAEENARKRYQEFIASPGALLAYARQEKSLTDEEKTGVVVNDNWIVYDSLSYREDKQFSVAFLDFSFITKKTLISSVEFVETIDGVMAQAKGEIRKERRVNGDTRYVNFINSFFLNNGKMWNHTIVLPLNSISLSYGVRYEDDDNTYKLGMSDANSLLVELANSELIDEGVAEQFTSEIAMFDRGQSLTEQGFSLSLELAIPPYEVRNFVRFVASDTNKAVVRQVIIDSMSRFMTDEISKYVLGLSGVLKPNMLSARETIDPDNFVASAIYNLLRRSGDVVEDDFDAIRRNRAIAIRTLLQNIGSFEDRLDNLRGNLSSVQKSAFGSMNWLKHKLPHIISCLYDYFNIADTLFAYPLVSKGEDRDKVSQYQNKMLKSLDPLLSLKKPRFDQRSGEFNWIPARTACLFDILQNLYARYQPNSYAPLSLVLKRRDAAPVYLNSLNIQ